MPRLKYDDDGEFLGANIGDANLIERLMDHLGRAVTFWIRDDDVRPAAQDDVERARNAAKRIRRRNIRKQEQLRQRDDRRQ